MSSLLEHLALKAVEVAEAEEEETKESTAPQAAELVRQSPLAKWFPEIAWEVLDHNVHLAPLTQVFVTVTAQEEEPVEHPLRFAVVQTPSAGPTQPQWQVLVLHPRAATAPPWQTLPAPSDWRSRVATPERGVSPDATEVRSAVHVGYWIRDNGPRRVQPPAPPLTPQPVTPTPPTPPTRP